MENFKAFEVENQEMIFGGELQKTVWSGNGESGTDFYDTEKDRVIYAS
ncbi:hypothetical protein [Pedobacter zeae]|uniref:Uncharacterized protein n=1 Tax=Pedobacter zeae TaxID=1737356 RepID=A0A7W6P4G9_9SPHI|nr:hypothetical protein [Pedobacter zeae]MBB4106748.1 hypothetical protein [Pedobacter zeae]GGH03511.1 hypothetical protein GCM10007422_18610 [Pedobacter zeae]